MAETDPRIHRLLGWASLDPEAENINADAGAPKQDANKPSLANPLRSTQFLAAAILLAPVILMIVGGGSGEAAVFGMVMVSGPILIGLMAQRVKGRTGALWWLLSLVVMLLANVLSGGGQTPDVLARTIMFGALPMAIIVWSLPRRNF